MTDDADASAPAGAVATVWAHYDDDLIFANPTLFRALDAGQAVRSFFFTASDSGKGLGDYSDGRERGIRAAYDAMRGSSGPWRDETVTLDCGLSLTVTRPEGDDRVALSFLRLPDGGTTGGGWFPTGYQTLPKLYRGELASLRTLGIEQDATLDLIRDALVEQLAAFAPATIITHHPGFADPDGVDHPDHQTVGRIMAGLADDGRVDAASVRYASGYNAAARPANLSPDDLARKLEVFAAYGAHDPVVMRTDPQEYLGVPGFGDWLRRQYLVRHDELER